ncbi:MAG: AAA family ATPase [Candidatus Aminicenantes bacterium]|nr:AAA family ATPase [Candidatus Aminicenantes bacterium]NIM77207.1 AAA family ATPase [Candidatus Aminicenantes bacterium]NIN16501.1 AAA family ATPase [Candidatus Aminicenantes bacterium]NIN40361.1 AAA family ATPase [Candidatus Aminicenantes bacterium]NIN83181.1 AAA family ATPase [Candidatus Aminicenantes bacterium]
MGFIDRSKELKALEKEYKRDAASFLVVYGRRRVGKTTLIKEFFKNKTALYYLADTQGERIQVNRFKNITAHQWDDNLLRNLETGSWDTVFDYLVKQKYISKKEKLIIVIDEFQYLVKANKAVPSIFQRIWDELLKDTNVMLILCGSVISMMYSSTLSYSSPLYGRRTSQLKLLPLKFKDFSAFFKGKTPVQLIELYSILSGIPKYIEIFEDCGDIFEAIENNMLDKDSFLYHEPLYILNEELSETATYFSLMEVISKGEHKIGNIARRLQIPTTHLTSFLNRLIDLELIEREVPVTEVNPSKSKRGLYFLKDHFFRFWFRYVLPYRSYIEIENTGFVMDKIKQDFSLYGSRVFEKICMEQVMLNPPLEIQKIGRWWNNNEEIDIAAVGESEILVGECKWWNEKVGVNVLKELERKAALIEDHSRWERVYFALFSKSGFTPELEQKARESNTIFLYDFSTT